MKRSASEPFLRAELRPVEEWTDTQLQALIDLGRREAELLNALGDAVAHDDRDLAWQIAVAIRKESGKE